MKIMVNGTERILNIIGKNECEWTEDFIGAHDYPHTEDGITILTEDELNYWIGEIELQEKIDELVDTLRPECGTEVDDAIRDYQNDRDGLYAQLQQIAENI